jgi:hypothetical protein
MKIIIFLRTMIETFKKNLNRTTTVIRISNDMTQYTYFLSTLWTGISSVCVALLIGTFGAVLISGCYLFYQYLFYRFRFKAVLPSATWKDYLEYRESPETYAVKTRGGSILVLEMLEALETVQINPILGFIQSYCFGRPGVYKINLRKWSEVIKELNNLGLITWFSLQGKSIGLLNLDTLLLAVFKGSNFITFTLPVIGNVQILIYELSRAKLLFNIVALLSVMTFTTLSVGAALTQLILTRFGFLVAGARAGQYASSFFGVAIGAIGTYAGGQFVPPQCESFAEYLKEVEMVNGKIPIPLSELDSQDVILYVPPKQIELVDIPVDPSGIEMPELGSIERRDNSITRRNLRGPQTKQFREIEQVFDNSDANQLSCPTDAPIFQRMKEGIKNIEGEFSLE